MGIPADGAGNVGDPEPSGRPGLHQRHQANIVDPSLEERGGLFFAAVEITRMLMIRRHGFEREMPGESRLVSPMMSFV